MSIDLLFANFDQYLPLEKEEREMLSACMIEKTVKRRQFILQEGEICKYYSFVAKGCFKKYYVDEKGTEHNLQFIAENDWIMEIDSFFSEKPSRVYIEAIEPAVIFLVSKPDLIQLYMKSPNMGRIIRVIVETRLVELENRVLQSISSTAEERYLSFLSQYPHLTSRLPNTQIASYLGITPEFLSKVRKDLSRKS